MLRVAMIGDHSDQHGKVDGGVQAVTKYLVNAMKNIADAELHVISHSYGIDTAQTIEEDGYMRYVLPGKRFGTMTGYWQSQFQLGKLLKSIRPDIVHGQGVGHDGIIAMRSPYPSVLTIHGILPEEASHFPSARRRARHRVQNELSKHYCIRNAQHTILISPYVADYWGDLLGGQHYLIPNPTAPGFFEIDRQEERGRILFAGKIRSLKGVTDLVRAAATISIKSELKIVLAGSLEESEYVKLVKHEVDAAGMGGQVDFVGILDDLALRQELSRAAVLVLPSYQETAPMVIQEAMASGVPVIATTIGGIPYQVDDGESGFLFDPGDVDTMAKRIETLLCNRSMRQSFSATAKSRALENYQADSVAAATVEIYKQIIGT
ncbi:MAG: glycosyltransferase family 4 protein [Woeseia sp.]|jgi:glycosyltransferase involved in cell wall biosynthesis|nr:glycosyltransferase family 4 protein [Woeseia sp.]MBT6208538.1 glycosyltransferase family 4 protein [Woeseia sp.]